LEGFSSGTLRPTVRNGSVRLRDVAREAPEPLVAIVLGVLFSALGLLEVAEGKTLSEVSLLVLSVLALSVVRDRVSRASVAKELARLDDDVRSLLSGEPYYVLHYTSAIDIQQGGCRRPS
jgi:hypothetical protein